MIFLKANKIIDSVVFFCESEKNQHCGITLRVFGVARSYLVCIELIRDVLRKIKIFDEKIFFPMKNLKS